MKLVSKDAAVREQGKSNESKLNDLPPPRRQNIIIPYRSTYLVIFKTIVCLTTILLLTTHYPHTSLYRKSKYPRILLWNGEGEGEIAYQCGCVITTNRYNTKRSVDAVVINANRPYILAGLDKLKYKPYHLVVFAARRPLTAVQNSYTVANLAIFNYSMGYRPDSDLIWTQYYFSTVAKVEERVQTFHPADLSLFPNMPERAKFNLQMFLKSKTLLAAYKMYEVNDYTMPQSLYLEQLRKHADLNAISTCELSFLYKFMLIFEHSSCPDYVNSQFYMALANYMVPVVIGVGGNLSQLVPPGSYVNGKDFDSPKQLVQYLRNVSAEPQLYQQFFWWHTKYQVNHIKMPYCALCQQLRQRRGALPAGKFVNWWNAYKCPNQTNGLNMTLKPVL